MSADMPTRRAVNLGLAVAAGSLIAPKRARAAAATAITLSQYHNQPVESPLHKRLSEMWAAIATETGGRVQAKLFPENNRAGGDKRGPLELLLAGEIDFLTSAGNGLASLVPAADVQATPYAFRTPAQVYRALDGDLGEYLRGELRAKGLYAIPGGCFENGIHQITCTWRPVRNAGDFKGLKIRVPGSPLYQDFFRSLGAEISTMNISDIYQALKDKKVEAQDDPWDVVELFKFYEVQKFASITEHSWSGYNQVANLRKWQALPADMQAVIERNTRKFCLLQRADTDALNDHLRHELEVKGMVFNEVDKASFKPALTAFYPRWKEHVGQRAWNLLEGHVGRLG